jgi:hypothetical protein
MEAKAETKAVGTLQKYKKTIAQEDLDQASGGSFSFFKQCGNGDCVIEENPVVGEEYIVLPNIAGGDGIPVLESPSCKMHSGKPVVLTDCEGDEQLLVLVPNYRPRKRVTCGICTAVDGKIFTTTKVITQNIDIGGYAITFLAPLTETKNIIAGNVVAEGDLKIDGYVDVEEEFHAKDIDISGTFNSGHLDARNLNSKSDVDVYTIYVSKVNASYLSTQSGESEVGELAVEKLDAPDGISISTLGKFEA